MVLSDMLATSCFEIWEGYNVENSSKPSTDSANAHVPSGLCAPILSDPVLNLRIFIAHLIGQMFLRRMKQRRKR